MKKIEDVSRMCISRDGRILGTTSEHATIWDVATGKELRRVPGEHNLALAPDGRTFLTQRIMNSHGHGASAKSGQHSWGR